MCSIMINLLGNSLSLTQTFILFGETTGKHRKLHPAEQSCTGTHKTHTHTPNIHQLTAVHHVSWHSEPLLSPSGVTLQVQFQGTLLPSLHHNSQAESFQNPLYKQTLCFFQDSIYILLNQWNTENTTVSNRFLSFFKTMSLRKLLSVILLTPFSCQLCGFYCATLHSTMI